MESQFVNRTTTSLKNRVFQLCAHLHSADCRFRSQSSIEMTPSDHPSTCRTCHGSGWQRGPDNPVRHRDGHILRTTSTVVACTHHWANDDPTPEPVIDLASYLARYPDDDALGRTREHYL